MLKVPIFIGTREIIFFVYVDPSILGGGKFFKGKLSTIRHLFFYDKKSTFLKTLYLFKVSAAIYLPRLTFKNHLQFVLCI